MVQLKKLNLVLLLMLVLVIGFSFPALALSEKELKTSISESAKYMMNTVKAPQVGSIGGEWAVIGLARSGTDVPQKYWDNYYANVENYVKSHKGVLHTKKNTEYSRVIVALSAIGADPTNVAGYNLLIPLGDYDQTVWQGINGPIWALIALDSGSYDMPINTKAKTQATRQMYIDEILRCQLKDGGWNLTFEEKDKADPDITAMALQALAKYKDQYKVKTAIDKALIYLSENQDGNGGYTGWGNANSESIVQVIVALCELGIDIEDSRFIKNGNTLMDNLMTYRLNNGGFKHDLNSNESNLMATEQGLYGMVAAMRALEGKNSLYSMKDSTITVSESISGDNIGLPGKHPDVKKVPIIAPGTTFADIIGHKNSVSIKELASRGIITGYNETSFGPNDTMTRAQFSTIVVRGLGLPMKSTNVFKDVPSNSWYEAYVATAYRYGIINGRTETTFDPNGTITRQEAAAMVARAAKLCGMDTTMETYEILNVLAQFEDYISIAEWAKESMAVCYEEDIFDQSDIHVEPTRAILRCEIAQMLYNMLAKANMM